MKSISYRLADAENLELRAEILVFSKLINTENLQAVAEIIDSGKRQNNESCALTLYFAEAEESVWEIAKRYRTDRDALLKENGISEDILTDKMLLLIPEA